MDLINNDQYFKNIYVVCATCRDAKGNFGISRNTVINESLVRIEWEGSKD